jgi:hypothetical protein
MGKVDVALRLSCLPSSFPPDKSDPGLDHGMTPAKDIQMSD